MHDPGYTYWWMSRSAPLALGWLGGLAWRPARPRVASVFLVGLLVVAVAGQPGRWREFSTLAKRPQYGVIVDTLRRAVEGDQAISRVFGADTAAREVNPALLFALPGGVREAEGDALGIYGDGSEIQAGGDD